MKKNPLDTITCSDVIAWKPNERLELLGSTGEKTQCVKIVGRPNGVTMTVRGLKWYERVWDWIVARVRMVTK